MEFINKIARNYEIARTYISNEKLGIIPSFFIEELHNLNTFIYYNHHTICALYYYINATVLCILLVCFT